MPSSIGFRDRCIILLMMASSEVVVYGRNRRLKTEDMRISLIDTRQHLPECSSPWKWLSEQAAFTVMTYVPHCATRHGWGCSGVHNEPSRGNRVGGRSSPIYGSGCCLAAKLASAFWRISASALGSWTLLESVGCMARRCEHAEQLTGCVQTLLGSPWLFHAKCLDEQPSLARFSTYADRAT